jgi:ferredoxin
LHASGGVYPRRLVDVQVDRDKCTGCGMCVTQAPDLMRMDAQGKATVIGGPFEWSRADGGFVTECPVQAIGVDTIEGDGHRHRTMEFPAINDETDG